MGEPCPARRALCQGACKDIERNAGRAHRRPATEVDGTDEGCAGARPARTKQRVQLLLHSWRGGSEGEVRFGQLQAQALVQQHAEMCMLEQAATSGSHSRREHMQPEAALAASKPVAGWDATSTNPKSAHPAAVLEQVVCLARLSREQLPGAASVVKAWLEGCGRVNGKLNRSRREVWWQMWRAAQGAHASHPDANCLGLQGRQTAISATACHLHC